MKSEVAHWRTVIDSLQSTLWKYMPMDPNNEWEKTLAWAQQKLYEALVPPEGC